jgi:glycosyltransferase involved in cell wall biosynthesis
MSSLRVAIVHDWLVAAGGAERVLARMLQLFPRAKVYTLFGDASAIPLAANFHLPSVKTSWLQGLPGLRGYYRKLAPLMPWAVESLRVRDVDLVLSSAWAFAHGVRLEPTVPHLAYIHSPMRWAWDMRDDYLAQSGLSAHWLLGGLARWQIQRLREWDVKAATRPTRLVANSQFIQGRIQRCWQRSSDCLYPPARAPLSEAALQAIAPHGAFITMSRLVPYKRVDAIVKAFGQLPHLRLIVAGDGPERARLQAMATSNVEFTGWVTEDRATALLAGSQGFIQASKEDFGIAAVEAQACGVPVLTYGEGGALETVRPARKLNEVEGESPEGQGATGALVHDLHPLSFAQAIAEFAKQTFHREDCQANARRFSPEAFDTGLINLIESTLSGS